MLNNVYYIITEYYIDNNQVIKMLCQSERNAMIHARLFKSNHPESYYDYRVYRLDSGKVYTDLQPMFDTRGDEFPW